jgi:hypothetical protein
MVQVYLSEKYPQFYYTLYSKTAYSEEDDVHVAKYLKDYIEKHDTVYYVCEMDPSGAILDKKWFEASDIGNFDKKRSIKKMIGFGFAGVQKSFWQVYLKEIAKFGLIGEVYANRLEFEAAYKVSVKEDFKLIFTYEHKK